MAWFVKTETFTAVAVSLPLEQRRPTLEAHRHWVFRKLQQAAVYAAVTWWMVTGGLAAGVC